MRWFLVIFSLTSLINCGFGQRYQCSSRKSAYYSCLLIDQPKTEIIHEEQKTDEDVKEVKIRTKTKTISTKVFEIFPELHVLQAIDNEVSTIDEKTFENAKNLRKLDLKENSISDLQRNAFEGALHLEKINLNQNKLRVIDEHAFEGLSALVNLKLKSNQISQLHKNTFAPLPKLKKIDLSMNGLRFLHKDLFKHENNMELVSVNLEDNLLNSIHGAMFKYSASLVSVNLEGNDCIDMEFMQNEVQEIEVSLKECSRGYLIDEKRNEEFDFDAIFPKSEVMEDDPFANDKADDKVFIDEPLSFSFLTSAQSEDSDYIVISKSTFNFGIQLLLVTCMFAVLFFMIYLITRKNNRVAAEDGKYLTNTNNV